MATASFTAFRPRDKGGLIGTREPLQIDPGVVSAHIRIDKRSCRIENRLLLHAGELLVRGFFGLPGCELCQDGEGPRPAKRLPSRPLHKGRAVDLRPRALGQDADGETAQDRIV